MAAGIEIKLLHSLTDGEMGYGLVDPHRNTLARAQHIHEPENEWQMLKAARGKQILWCPEKRRVGKFEKIGYVRKVWLRRGRGDHIRSFTFRGNKDVRTTKDSSLSSVCINDNPAATGIKPIIHVFRHRSPDPRHISGVDIWSMYLRRYSKPAFGRPAYIRPSSQAGYSSVFHHWHRWPMKTD